MGNRPGEGHDIGSFLGGIIGGVIGGIIGAPTIVGGPIGGAIGGGIGSAIGGAIGGWIDGNHDPKSLACTALFDFGTGLFTGAGSAAAGKAATPTIKIVILHIFILV